MNRVDLMELLKRGGLSAFMDLLKQAKLISYGVIVDVLDAQTVRAAEVVKTGISERNHLATLFYPSSALLEVTVLPQPGDLVLLVFLQKYHPAMFGLHRKVQDAVIYDEVAEGYHSYSAVAVLLTPPKGASATKIRFGGTTAQPELALTTMAELTAELRGAVAALFDGDAPVSFLFGKLRPVHMDYRGTLTRRHGFIADTVTKELLETDAAVTEEYSKYAPITRNIQGAEETVVGLGTDPGGDPEGSPVETEAPITETIHGKSPVVKDVRSPITVTVGIGNAESGDSGEQRDAPVSFTLGEKAPIVLTSKSGMTLHFDKPVIIDGDETWDVTFDGKITITGNDGAAITIQKAIAVTGNDTADVTIQKAIAVTGKDTATADITKKITVNGGGQITVHAGSKVFIGNDIQSLYTVLTALVTEIKNLVTFGHPGIHKVTPVSQTALELFQQQYIEPLLTSSK
jgi:hypothetical protein